MRTPTATTTYMMLGIGITLLVAAAAVSLAPADPTPGGTRVAPPVAVQPVVPTVASPMPAAATLPASTGADTVKLTAALGRGAVLENSAEPNYARLHVEARRTEMKGRGPVSIAVALDRSGSMSGAKLDQAKAAVDHLIDALQPEDRLALVAYDDYAHLLYPTSPLTPDHRAAMHRVVAGVEPQGSTNLSSGLEEAARQARRGAVETEAVARVLLVSDGLANRGITEPTRLADLARRFRADSVTVSTIGVGADFDHRVMSDLAESGAGQYHYLDQPEKLAGVFADELRQVVTAVARDVQLLVKLAPGVRISEVYGFKHSLLASGLVAVLLPDLHSGAGWQVILKLEGAPATGASMQLAESRLVYTDLVSDRARQVAAAEPLVAEVTSRPQRVSELENTAVMVEVVRMEGALAAQRASELLEQGRNQEAAQAIAAAQQATDRANKRYNSGILSMFSGNLRGLFAASANTLGGEERRHLAKKQHRMMGSFSNTSSR